MNARNWMQRTGATPGKLALVCLLVVALVGVLWKNRASDAPSATRRSSSSVTEKSGAGKKKSSPAPEPDAARRQWPQIALEEAIKHDPFSKPAWYLSTLSTTDTAGDVHGDSERVVEKLRKEPSKIVMISGGQRVATIGDQNLRVGDTIGGLEVKEISTDEILLIEVSK